MDLQQGNTSPIDMKQLLFNNLQFLGLDAPAMEASNHIPFNKTMFDLPNRRGAEIVLHFLFQRLNPITCKEAFRDCWPIHDKKREQTFRKTCSNWLVTIAKDDPDSHLPRINASLFMSPGGDKFYQLLFHFSGYVLRKVLEKELGSSCSEDVTYPALTSQNLQLGEVMKKNLISSSIRHRNGYFTTPQQTLKANRKWHDTAEEFKKETRNLNKEIRELEYKKREEEQAAIQTGLARGSPVKSRGHNEQFDPNFDPRTIKRAQRLQQVREMWKQLDDFEHSEAAEREVIESIVERTINKHRIDAADISVKVPDMLLRECADEIRRRNVDNTYHGGKLNLVSVIQLWNLCLHLYQEKLQEVGVPKFENEVEKLGSQVHTQQSYLKNAQTLREQMQARIPVMKASIESLRERLDDMFFKDTTPTSVRSTSLGYGLVEPSPQPSFSPEHGQTPAGGIGIPRDTQKVETPEAVAMISEEIETTVRRGPDQLFSDLDIQLKPVIAGNRNNSALPQPTTGMKSRSVKSSSQASSRHSSRPTSARSVASSKGSKRSEKSTPKASPRAEKEHFPTVQSPRTMMDSFRSIEHSLEKSPFQSPKSQRSIKSEQSEKLLPHSTRSQGSRDDRLMGGEIEINGRLTPTDYLVEEIMGESAVLPTCTSGLEAFASRDQVQRTPDLPIDEINKENITPTNSVAADSPTHNKRQIENIYSNNVDEERQDSSRSRDVFINADLEDTKQKYMREVNVRDRETVLFDDILGPELEEEYDNDEGSDRSQENLVIIDRSLNVLQETREPAEFQLSESPDICTDQQEMPYLDDSPMSTPRAIVIDKSFHLSPRQQEKREGLNGSQHSASPKVSPRYQPASPARLDSPRNPEGKSFSDSPSRQLQMVRPKLPENLRSPLSDEIRKMFQDAIADTTPKKSASPRGLGSSQKSDNDVTNGKETKVLKRSLSGSSKGSFIEQVQLEDLVVGDNIVKKDSDYLSRSGYLSAAPLRELQQKSTEQQIVDLRGSPKVDDILRRVKMMEERMLGKGTPLGSSSDLELPVMDPNSRIPDSDDDDREPLEARDISWELTENLDDIEMPDLDIDQDLDNDNNDSAFKTLDDEKQTDVEIDLNFKPVDLDEFFESKTPELPKRMYSSGIQSESLQSNGSSLQMPKFPQVPTVDDSPLMTFTP